MVGALALIGFGCGGDDSSDNFSSSFAASGTTATANLVKLVPKGASGSRLVVDAVIYGPTSSTDIYSFSFDVVIGDPNVLAFVPGSAVAGTALTAGAGQTIQAIAAPDSTDASHIVVGVSKIGGGTGNAVSGTAGTVVVELSFNFITQGNSTLAIATSPAPAATNSGGTTIGSVDFDAATGTATGVASSGGPY